MSAWLHIARIEIYAQSFPKWCSSQKCSIREPIPKDKLSGKNKKGFFRFYRDSLCSKLSLPCYLPELLLENLRLQNFIIKLTQKSIIHTKNNIQTYV